MAYNPFNIFRRNQKAIFAVVTVFIMFTFVLSSGLGGGADFFDWLPRWLGQKSKKGDVMCSIDESKVYESELTQLRFDRVMANRFMNLASTESQQLIIGEALAMRPRLSPQGQQILSQFERMAMDPNMAPFLAQFFTSQLRSMLDSPVATSEDKAAARLLFAGLTMAQARGAAGPDHYFVNLPNQTNRDLVNFLLWRKKADQLGIKLTTDHVKKLIHSEFMGYFQPSSEVAVRKYLQQNMANFNLNRCIEAIGEELRVRMAQVAVLGPDFYGHRSSMTFGGYPMFATSYEAFDFYREQCSPTTYGAIPVPAINFLSQVPEPDESNSTIRSELVALYDKHKNDEPNLGRESPGLKEPRKIKVEWLSVSGAEPYYVKLAEEQLQQGELHAKIGSMLTVPLLSASPMVMASATAPLTVKEPLLLAAYDKVIQDHKFSLSDRYASPSVMLGVLDSSVVRPGVLVGSAGHSAGQALAFGHPLAALAGTATAPLAYELRDRVKAGVPAVLLALGSIPAVKTDILGLSIGHPVPGPLPGPALFANLMGAHVAYEMMLPKPLPIDAVKPELTKNLIASTAKNIAFGEPVNPNRPGPPTPPKKGDLQTFIDEVNKLSDNGKVRPSDKEKFAALQKYITEFAVKRGIPISGNRTPLSEWQLEGDPGLAPLLTAQKESLKRSPHQQQADYVPFANRFFWEEGDRRKPVSGVYRADFYPEQRPQFRDPTREETKPQYVIWRTEEVPAKVPPSFSDALPAVKAVWKHLKARDLAKKRADELAKAIEAASASSEATVISLLLDQSSQLESEFAKDPAARDRIKPFHIQGVCPLTTVGSPTAFNGLIPSFAGPPPGQMHEFRFPPSENVKFPAREMGQKLLDERTKPVKTVLVLTDEPKDIYFVTTLMKRDEKQSWEFQNLLRQDATGNQRIVLSSYIGHGRDKTFASVMGLLKKEFKYEETEEQKKKLDERRGGD
jgi:hypothetical protein